MTHPATNETGNRYGNLVVIERTEDIKPGIASWLCRCDCGNFTRVFGWSLRAGNVKSCGCKRGRCGVNVIDESGKRYGKLLVVKRVEGETKQAHWLCACDCGNTRVVLGSALRRGAVVSCGCTRHLPSGESGFRSMFRRIKKAAETRGYEFQLSENEVREITRKPCFYCGKSPSQKAGDKRNYGKYTYNGIDRVDSTKGYVSNNVVPSCGRCNYAKSKYSVDEFREWVVSVYSHWVTQS